MVRPLHCRRRTCLTCAQPVPARTHHLQEEAATRATQQEAHLARLTQENSSAMARERAAWERCVALAVGSSPVGVIWPTIHQFKSWRGLSGEEGEGTPSLPPQPPRGGEALLEREGEGHCWMGTTLMGQLLAQPNISGGGCTRRQRCGRCRGVAAACCRYDPAARPNHHQPTGACTRRRRC